LLIVDPNTNEARDLRVPVWDPETQSYFPTNPGFEPSVFWERRSSWTAPPTSIIP